MVENRKGELLAVGEAFRAIFRSATGFNMRIFESSRFSTEGTLNLRPAAVLLTLLAAGRKGARKKKETK